MRIAKSTYRKSLLSLAIFLWLGAFCVLLVYGCYPNIKWAKENHIRYGVRSLTMEEMAERGYSDETRGVYIGWTTTFTHAFGRTLPIDNHRILMRKWVYESKDSDFVLNHELGHVRYPDWRH